MRIFLAVRKIAAFLLVLRLIEPLGSRQGVTRPHSLVPRLAVVRSQKCINLFF